MSKISSKHKKSAMQSHGPTKAIHASTADGEHHAVAIWNLHVLLIPEGKFWVAQGLEVDYVVQGDSIEDAKKNFEQGLEATIDLNLKMYGNIQGLLVMSPDSVLQQAAKHRSSIKLYGQISTHEIGAQSQSALPFDGIRYLEMEGEAA